MASIIYMSSIIFNICKQKVSSTQKIKKLNYIILIQFNCTIQLLFSKSKS